MDYLSYIINLIENSSILSGFLSGFLVLVIGSLLLPRYIQYLKRPKLIEFFYNETGTQVIFCEKNMQDEYEFSFEPVILHSNGDSLNQGLFWQLSFPGFVEVKVQPIGKETLPGFNIDRETGAKTFFGRIEYPIFRDTTFRLQYKFFCKFNSDDIGKNFPLWLPFWFSTEFGDYPRHLKRLSKNGMIDPKSMGKLWVQIE